MMRAKYECDKCGARFTTDPSLVDNETPLQRGCHSYVLVNTDHDASYEHLCQACFDGLPPIVFEDDGKRYGCQSCREFMARRNLYPICLCGRDP